MTGYRFRFKFDPDPTELWRDVLAGADRTVADLQSTVNDAFGLDQDHAWFVGEDESYWQSDTVYECPQFYDDGKGTNLLGPPRRVESAGEVTIGELTRQLGLEQYDRICYLYDYGDEWRFYAILKEIRSEESATTAPTVVNEKGEPVDQYGADNPANPSPAQALPDPLPAVFSPGPLPVDDLREFESRDDVEHALPLHTVQMPDGETCDRCLVQCADVGYVLEQFEHGWDVVRKIDGETMTTEAHLDALAETAREWHHEIAEISELMTGRSFADATVADMHSRLDRELERRGYADF